MEKRKTGEYRLSKKAMKDVEKLKQAQDEFLSERTREYVGFVHAADEDGDTRLESSTGHEIENLEYVFNKLAGKRVKIRIEILD